MLLPTIQVFPNGDAPKPARLQGSIDSGYAERVPLGEVVGRLAALTATIERANVKPKRLIVNTRERMPRDS